MKKWGDALIAVVLAIVVGLVFYWFSTARKTEPTRDAISNERPVSTGLRDARRSRLREIVVQKAASPKEDTEGNKESGADDESRKTDETPIPEQPSAPTSPQQKKLESNVIPTKFGGISGEVTISGKPVVRGGVSVQVSNGDGINSAEFGPDGQFQIDRVAVGTAYIRVRASLDGLQWREHSDTVEVTEGNLAPFTYDFPATGTLTGTVTGLTEDEGAGIFAIKGEYKLSNVTEDDLYDFGGIADGEARAKQDGTFSMKGLDAGRYTVVGIAEHFDTVNGETTPRFWYVTEQIEVPPDGEVAVNLSFEP